MIKVIHEQLNNYRTGVNRGEVIGFNSEGWWGEGPLTFRRDDHEWRMSTSSGGQNSVDVMVQIREMKAMLEYAESVILESRAIEQEYDGMEIIDDDQ